MSEQQEGFTSRRSVLKGAGGLAPGALGVGSGKAERVEAALNAQDATPTASGKRPTVVAIMRDDVSWGDPGCYGGGPMCGAPTPHLEQRAAEGMRFANSCGQASCTAPGPSLPLTSAPAMYTLFRDSGEQCDSPFIGAMPNAGEVCTSSGRFSGADHGGILSMFMTPALKQHFEEIAQYPNKPSQVHGGPFFEIPSENRPE